VGKCANSRLWVILVTLPSVEECLADTKQARNAPPRNCLDSSREIAAWPEVVELTVNVRQFDIVQHSPPAPSFADTAESLAPSCTT